jgi:hypothetical protein
MAAVPVEIRATLYDLASKSSRQVYIVGDLVRSGVGVGGGPIVPPGNGGGQPPGIWGGGNEPFPTPPIAIPRPPTEPPPDGADKPPPADGGWGFVAEWSAWGYFPGPTEAGPKG